VVLEAFELLPAIDGFIALFRWGLGWRYVFSSRFRAKVHAEWRLRSKLSVCASVVFGSLIFTLLNLVLFFFAYGTLHWLYQEAFLVHLRR
jgi:hypothetical protein